MTPDGDVVVIGAGAAGLFAGIWCARTAPSGTRVVLVDGARKLGAKILVAGGGRCNVTHHAVDEEQYAGSSRNAIRKVLRSFDVPQTIAFFREQGVELKREDTGKLFPTTDDARTVLDALLKAARDAGAIVIHPWRVSGVEALHDGFRVHRDVSPTWASASTSVDVYGAATSLHARRVIIATGGKSLPRTGSDGAGHAILRALGHSITPHVFPALVPLTLPDGWWLTKLSGLTLPARLEVRAASGKSLVQFTNSTLITHFGLSGPAPLDISRYYAATRLHDPNSQLIANWLPDQTAASIDAMLIHDSRSAAGRLTLRRWIVERGLPERFAEAIVEKAGLSAGALVRDLTREVRGQLVGLLAAMPLPITGDRGYTYAEVTAGGVPLAEVDLATMASRRVARLHLCGEVLDVDGRIGGFNFQWAWASGYLAGVGAARALAAP